MTSCFVARISNPGERFGKPFYEGDVPSLLRFDINLHFVLCIFHKLMISARQAKISTV